MALQIFPDNSTVVICTSYVVFKMVLSKSVVPKVLGKIDFKYFRKLLCWSFITIKDYI